MSKIEEELAAFPPTAITARVIGVLGSVVPGAPPLPGYTTVEEAANSALGGVPADVVARARELLAQPRIDQALFAARTIDTGDTGLTIVSGVRSAMALFFGKGDRSEAMAQQQRTDAAVKAFGLAYLVTRLLPVAAAERMELIRSVPAGRQLLLYFGAIEVAVPFAAEVEAAKGQFVSDLVKSQGRAMADKVLAVVGREGAADAQEMLGEMAAELDRAALAALPHTAALAERIRGMLPAAAAAVNVFDLVAAGVDALPSYRYLVSRLAIEASLALAKHELMPDVPLPSPPVTGETVAAPPPPPVPLGLRTVDPSGVEPVVDPGAVDVPERPPEAPPPPPPAPPPVVTPLPPVAPPPVAVDPLDAPPPPPSLPPSLPPFRAWPTTALPEAQRLRGFYVVDGDPARWQIFTVEGVFTDAPWAEPGTPDWDAHLADGHAVATYRREGDELLVNAPGGVRRTSFTRDDRSLTIDGTRWARADWDLSKRSMDGRWDGPDSLTLAPDGVAVRGARSGRYELGVGRITFHWDDGSSTAATFLTDLHPSSKRPAVLWLGGHRYRLGAM